MEAKKYKYNNDDLVWNKPDNICAKCKGCINASKEENGYELGICAKYPDTKPIEIILKQGNCKFYQST